MDRFEVIVGNVGCVYSGSSQQTAWLEFVEYRAQSAQGYGRAAGESVACLHGGDIIWEHVGTV